MPICPMFCTELAKTAKFAHYKQDPFKKVAKFFKTADPFESAALQPRVVPRKLLQEVPSEKVKNPGASGVESRLKEATPEGKKEQASLSSHKQACTWLRLVNSQELVVNALQTLHQKMETQLNVLCMDKQSPQVAHSASVLFGALDSAQLAVLDLQNTNLHMSRCATHQYSVASRSRQEAWLEASSLPGALKTELKKSDLDVCKATSSGPLNLIGSDALKILSEYSEEKKNAWVQQLAHQAVSQNKPRVKPQSTTQGFPTAFFLLGSCFW